MKINPLASTIYECIDDDEMRDFIVSKVGDRIVLYGSVGNQMFHYKEEFTKECLQQIFPTAESAKNRALLHTRGILNKERVTKNIIELYKDGIINFILLEKLQEFIKSCNCAPVRALEKMINQGFDLDIIKKLNIYEESPEMIETVRALLDFIREF